MRDLRFDVEALTALTTKAVGSSSCVEIEKCPGGMYNKAFLLTMNDGIQVVAKLPNPNAGPPHITAASEVASTMEFVSIYCRLSFRLLNHIIDARDSENTCSKSLCKDF